jgi:hypothetical protein
MEKEIPTIYSPPGMLDWPCGVERLSNGNTLITDGGYWSGKGSEILEVNPLGQIVWQFSGGLLFAHSAKELENGNILISDTGKNRVLETDRGGNVVWSSETWGGGKGKLSDGSHLSYPNDAEETTEGTILISDRNNDRLVEVDREGKIVWLYDKLKHCHGADRLRNANTMVASSDENKVYEIDPSSKIVWSYGDGSPEMLNWPRDADRLEKISLQQRRQVIEVDHSGSIVWSFRNYIQGHIKEHLKNPDFEEKSHLDPENPAHWTPCPLLSEAEPSKFIWDAVMGSEPESLTYLKKAFEKGVGSEYRVDEIEIRGANLENVCRKFEQADMASLWRKKGE